MTVLDRVDRLLVPSALAISRWEWHLQRRRPVLASSPSPGTLRRPQQIRRGAPRGCAQPETPKRSSAKPDYGEGSDEGST